MASTFTDLGLEIMATGENAGTWGDKTNTNLNIVNTAIAGYVEQSIAGGAATTTLTITDGAATSVAQNAVIKLTGSITGNQIVTIPNSIEKVYIITNGTSGAFTVQVKTVSGSGVTFGVSEKTTKLLYSDGTNIVDAGFSGGLDIEGRELVLDADGDTSLTADTDDQIDIKIAGADDFRFTANTFTALSGSGVVIPDSGLTLGSTAVTATAAEINILDGVSGLVAADLTKLAAVDSTAAELNIVDGGTSATSTTVADADRVVLNDNGTMVQVAVTDLAAYFDDEITAMPNLTSVGTLTTLTVDSIIINGTNIGHTSDADALAIDSSGNVTASQNLIVTGDLTVSGDDITMGTNTAGNLLVADGTNFNSVAVSSLSEISTAASGDLLLAVDASGGGLKKIARSTVVAGLATDSAIANIVEDTSPQLGGNLDTNSQNILIDDAHFIADESGNEQIIFQTTGSAVNQFDVTNAASGSGPQLSATGSDSNIDLNILPKGTGHVTVVGNTNSGTIQFNCESNSHGQIIRAQPHSASATNIMLLPEGADSTLVSLVSADTLTNKTLTAPKIADGGFIADANGNQLIVFQTTGSAVNELEITNNAAGSNPILAATGGDTNIGIALTPKGTGEIVIGAANLNYAGTAVTSTGAELNLVDGITAGTVSASLAVIADSNKDISGFRNVTLTGEVDAATGDFSGAVDIAGQLTVADGSAGAPAISNTGDANTGLLFSAADTLAFSAGGTAQFTMADGGIIPVTTNDVDLGTASLQFKNVFVDGTTFTDALGFGTVVMTLPTADGDANQILTTDGSGTLAFVDNSGGTDWQAVKTGNFTASAGQGIFANTTSAAFTVTLPAGSIGDEVSIIDYAGTFDSNALTVAANGSEKINASTDDLTISVERAALTLVFTDGTQGWLVRG